MHISITLIIIIVTALISINAFSNPRITEDLIFYPPAVTRRRQWYRFFSSGLIHNDWQHLIFNMLSLYFFGENVEKAFVLLFGVKGRILYLLLYVLAIGVSEIPTFLKYRNSYHYRSLGASGGVSAVIFAAITLNPINGIGFFFIPVYIAGFIYGAFYLWYSSWMDRRGGDNINHSAHFYGALFGIGFTIALCYLLADYPVVQVFIDTIKNADPSDYIQLRSN